jgi:hypothetical protein
MRLPRLLGLAALTAVLIAGCGGEDDNDKTSEGHGTVRESSGLHIITVQDQETGLKLEFQGDGLYLKLTDQTPADVRNRIKGHGLGGVCEGKPGDTIPGLTRGFQIFWRPDYGDWGSAVVRLPERKPALADVLQTCRIYAPLPGTDPVPIRGSTKPVAEIALR